MITVKEVKTRKELQEFVKLPFTLYHKSPYWVPPIIAEELDNLDPEKNPAYREADAWFYMAYKDNKPVGRIAAVINHIEQQEADRKKLRFGWFEAERDPEIAKALFQQVEAKARALNMDYLEGPSGFSNMDKAGLLIEGFDRMGSMTTHYNFDYYPEFLELSGFEKQVDWKEYEIDTPNGVPEKVQKFSALIKQKFQLEVMRFSSNSALIPHADAIFGLMNLSYAHLESFTPIKPYMVEHYKKKFLKFLDPEFVTLIRDQKGELVGFSVVMPSFARALQKANGKLFPFGFYHLLKAQKNNDKATLLLIGIHPEYMSKGLTAIIFDEVVQLFNRRGIKVVETNPELETNAQVQALWKDYEPRLIKRWRTYKKEL